jgi:hypothetical protein
VIRELFEVGRAYGGALLDVAWHVGWRVVWEVTTDA